MTKKTRGVAQNNGVDHQPAQVGEEAAAAAPGESSSLLNNSSRSSHQQKPLILHHDSVFSVDSSYFIDQNHTGTAATAASNGGPNNSNNNDNSGNNRIVRLLNLWQGAALLTADCMGTGILALPGNVHVLGYTLGLTFLIANLPLNLFAGTILARSAEWVEEKQRDEDRVYLEQQKSSLLEVETTPSQDLENDDDNDVARNNGNRSSTTYLAIADCSSNYAAGNNNNITTIEKEAFHHEHAHHHHLHHDTATFDFVGMTQAIFKNRRATTFVMLIYYVNIFLVLGNYILVMSHAVSAVFGEEWLCLPVAGLIASTAMFVVSQSRTMARLGRTASILSLTALFIVVGQCLVAIHQNDHDNDSNNNSRNNGMPQKDEDDNSSERSIWRKLSAMGSIGFAVGSQKLFLNIRHEFANRQEAPKSLAISLTAFGTIYVLVVLAAGSNNPHHGFLFDAIPGGGWNRRIAGLLLWAHVVVSYAINSQAICSSLDRLVWHRLPVGGGANVANNGAIRWMLLTGVMAMSAYTVANAIPFFKDLVALIGALTSVPLTLLFPAIFWRRYLQVPIWMPTPKTLCSYGLLVFSIVFTVAATSGAAYSIRQDWKSHGPPFSCH